MTLGRMVATDHVVLAEAPVPPLLIDGLLPRFDAVRLEHVVAEAPSPVCFAAAAEIDMLEVHTPLSDAAMWVRGLPDRFRRVSDPEQPLDRPPSARLRDLFDAPGEGASTVLPGWMPLGMVAGRELCFGAIGRFWTPEIEWRDADPEGFADFDEPGWGRIAASIATVPFGDHRSFVTYECRTAISDPVSRRQFHRYWTLVNPFVGTVLRAVLHAIADEAEERAS